MSGGQLVQLNVQPPPAPVGREICSAIGTGISRPPLNGAGVLAKEMNRTDGAEGLAPARLNAPGELGASVPLPASAGTPVTPATPPPRSSQVRSRSKA